MKEVLEKIKELTGRKSSEIFKVYADLHAIPEISMQEYKTSAYIADYLKDQGLDVRTGIGKTGLVAYIRGNEPGPVFGIRGDMDALNHIIDGKNVAIHSCGHDAHSTMVLFAGIIAKELGMVKRGALKLIFQPSEEREETSGASAMIEDGVLEDMDMCVGIHLRPINEGKLGQASSALRHGALTIITAKVMGEAAHGARPHLGRNTVDAIAAIINAVNAIWVNPAIPASAKVTSISAGGANYASIPERGDIGIDLRAETNEVMEELADKVKNAIITGASTIGCRVEIERIPGYPAAVFDNGMIEIAGRSIKEVLGDDGLIGEQRSPGGEDFHKFVQAKPELKTTYIGLGCDLKPGLHHPEMNFQKEALLDGVSILANMAHKILG